MRLGPDDVIVASGGGRGVTAASMIELALATAARFVLLGRTPLDRTTRLSARRRGRRALKRVLLDAATATAGGSRPPSSGERPARSWRTARSGHHRADRDAGGKARYLAVDVTDAAAVTQALNGFDATWARSPAWSTARACWPTGASSTRPTTSSTRVPHQGQGLRCAADATAEDGLKLLCVFSSVAARTGNEGQADYAMANEVLNKVAVAERARRGPAASSSRARGVRGPAAWWTPRSRPGSRRWASRCCRWTSGPRCSSSEIASPQIDQVEVMLGSATMREAGTGDRLTPNWRMTTAFPPIAIVGRACLLPGRILAGGALAGGGDRART